MDIALYVVAGLALLIAGAYGEHLLSRSKNPKVQKIDTQLDAILDGTTAEAAKFEAEVKAEAPVLADQVKQKIEAALKAISDAEAKAQAEVDAALARHEAVKADNATALATIQQAAAKVTPQA